MKIGHPEKIEQSPQRVAAEERHDGKDQPDPEVLIQRRAQLEQRKHDHLRCDRDAVADDNIRDRLNERHGARLHRSDCIGVRG